MKRIIKEPTCFKEILFFCFEFILTKRKQLLMKWKIFVMNKLGVDDLNTSIRNLTCVKVESQNKIVTRLQKLQQYFVSNWFGKGTKEYFPISLSFGRPCLWRYSIMTNNLLRFIMVRSRLKNIESEKKAKKKKSLLMSSTS